jgi:ABC-type transporter Mla subunit MlaD
MDILTITSMAIGLISIILSGLAQLAKTSEKTAPYAAFLERLDRLLSGKSTTTGSLEERLEKAIKQLTGASDNVNDILGEIQTDVGRKQKDADRLRAIIEGLRKEYETNKSLANLTADEAKAVRQILTKEVSSLKRKSYLPDFLINFGVGAFFFIAGIVVTKLIIK